MDNIVGYICSTPWGTVSRTTPSLGWTPVLPAIPDGWQDAGTGAAPTGFRIIVRPGTRFPTLFPKMPRAELAAVHAPDTEPGRWGENSAGIGRGGLRGDIRRAGAAGRGGKSQGCTIKFFR